MPYIKHKDRAQVNAAIVRLVDIITRKFEKPDAVLVYSIMKIVYWVKDPKNWDGHSDITKIFRRAEHEYERRMLDPYEDQKILENGDIF